MDTDSLPRWEWEGGALSSADEPGDAPEAERVIVCGVDGSPDAEEAARLAAQLAELAGARLALVAVVQVPVVHGAAGVPWSRRQLRASTLEAGAALLQRMAEAVGTRVPIDCHLELGDPVRRLIAVAERTRALALVVGTRGLGALRAAVLGSVAAGVCRQASCPVVVVPRAAAGRDLLHGPSLLQRASGR